MMGSRVFQSQSMFLHPGTYRGPFQRRRDPYDDPYHPDVYTRIIEPFISMHTGRDYIPGSDLRGRVYGQRGFPERVQPRYGLVDEYDDRDRYLEERGGRNAGPSPHTDAHDSLKLGLGRDPAVPENEAVSFVKAMRKLHHQLKKTEETFTDFKIKYDKETKAIKTYSTKEILEKLWVLRVKGEKDPKIPDGGDDDDEKLIGNRDNFELCQRKTSAALRDAMESAIKDGGNKAHFEFAERLKEKVRTVSRQIMRLQELALTGREHCEALLSELEELKNLVNPESAKNKAFFPIFKGGSSGGNPEGNSGGQEEWGGYNNDDNGGEYE